jgi:hypothetical protein
MSTVKVTMVAADDKKTGDDGVSLPDDVNPWSSVGDHNGFGRQGTKGKVTLTANPSEGRVESSSM